MKKIDKKNDLKEKEIKNLLSKCELCLVQPAKVYSEDPETGEREFLFDGKIYFSSRPAERFERVFGRKPDPDKWEECRDGVLGCCYSLKNPDRLHEVTIRPISEWEDWKDIVTNYKYVNKE